mmetsp:Transcript_20179/g.28154  ORF Transcript_20179/g.28154 Transcript_20179/m.28154 type:complete len:147 (-) Transcript_20179:490-930(-)
MLRMSLTIHNSANAVDFLQLLLAHRPQKCPQKCSQKCSPIRPHATAFFNIDITLRICSLEAKATSLGSASTHDSCSKRALRFFDSGLALFVSSTSIAGVSVGLFPATLSTSDRRELVAGELGWVARNETPFSQDSSNDESSGTDPK